MSRRWTTALVLPLALTACAGGHYAPGTGAPHTDAPRTIAVESYPARTEEASPPPAGVVHARVDAGVRPARLELTMWGTPGCMPYPVDVGWTDSTTVEVLTAAGVDPACSDEYLPVSQVVVLPVYYPADGVRTVRVDGATVALAVDTGR
ncbi:hypothetical protein ACFQHV_18055 [Promicromonospora thailandica]|uniref:LppP/LprE lipoprotein n=1 Tax=Promicromonospora thailandica TaxID=765201 RepID=A0A9X2FX17_9MICO|nr:hypothetical protein [Promicromonospora thailandica]MCP2262709.1 hypothetical protein [Promicromonospora thailandica]BFF18030.1 hypothetical protein GCM10025730_15510 [Promicromonospora thailandica]